MSPRQRRIQTALIVSFGAQAVLVMLSTLQAWPGFPPISGPVQVAIQVFGILSIISTVVFGVLLFRTQRDKSK
jgi:hypothetical protein